MTERTVGRHHDSSDVQANVSERRIRGAVNERPIRSMVMAGVLAAVTGLSVDVVSYSRAIEARFITHSDAQERAIAHAAFVAYGRPVKVACDLGASKNDVVGNTPVVGLPLGRLNFGLVELTPAMCDDISDFMSRPNGPLVGETDTKFSVSDADAVRVLAHEVSHVEGNYSESKAQCEAIQTFTQLAEALGSSEAVATQLQTEVVQLQVDEFGLAGQPNTDEYSFAHCYAGGPEDLHLPTGPVFPQAAPN